MSKLEELLEDYCPDGVEYKPLEDVIISLNTGLNPRKFFRLNTDDANNYYITIREISGGKIQPTEKTDRINDEALKLCNHRSNLEKDDVLFSGTGTIGEVAVIKEEPKNWNIKEGVYAIKPHAEYINSDFLAYLLRTEPIRIAYMKKVAGGTVKSVPMGELKKLLIPVPPLPVQEEIVRILDMFTGLTAELTAELTARKKQYEYYRDQMLTPANDSIPNKNISEIAEICDSERRPITKGKRISGEYPYYGASGIVDYVKDYIFDGDYLLISEDGANLLSRTTPIAFSIKGKCWVNNHAHVLKFKDFYTQKFVEFYLNNIDLSPYISAGAQPKLNQNNLRKILIPLPESEKIQQIVTTLMHFEDLCTSISTGLPAEIEAREKQYEYYRDKLLTFKRKA